MHPYQHPTRVWAVYLSLTLRDDSINTHISIFSTLPSREQLLVVLVVLAGSRVKRIPVRDEGKPCFR